MARRRNAITDRTRRQDELRLRVRAIIERGVSQSEIVTMAIQAGDDLEIRTWNDTKAKSDRQRLGEASLHRFLGGGYLNGWTEDLFGRAADIWELRLGIHRSDSEGLGGQGILGPPGDTGGPENGSQGRIDPLPDHMRAGNVPLSEEIGFTADRARADETRKVEESVRAEVVLPEAKLSTRLTDAWITHDGEEFLRALRELQDAGL